MALAPTLLTIREIAVGVGLVTMGGLGPTAETGARAPSVGAVSLTGLAPTVSVQLGPQAQPDVGLLSVVGQIPFLERILRIAPGLPDSAGEVNDLAPTLIWQETLLMSVGLARIQGLAPAVVGNTGQTITITAGSAIFVGLAPTVTGPAGQSGTTAPEQAENLIVGLTPTLTTELALAPEASGLTVTGFVPELFTRGGWTDVPPVTGSWTDVPRV
jgi:hypothetical protein